MSMEAPNVRVLVVDDSAFMRRALTHLINEGRGLEVVGTAGNGREACDQIKALRPDVVTMDVEMPEMDGVQALQALMSTRPVPVVMFSSLTSRGAEITMRCLELGAVDFLAKPGGSVSVDLSSIRYLLWQKLRSAAEAKLQPTREVASQAPKPVSVSRRVVGLTPATYVVAIGSSTGGPRALLDVLVALPADLPAAIAIVQHMPPQFTAAMARRFDENCAISVREAADGDQLEHGLALIAPGGRHMRIQSGGTVQLSDEPPVWGVRPAVDLMMEGVARTYCQRALGVILTGMGCDGTKGLELIKQHGGASFGQDEATCVVYGMPRAAYAAGVVDRVLPLPEIGNGIIRWCSAMTQKYQEVKV